MDNLHSGLREIVDHREDVTIAFDRTATSARPLAAKPSLQTTSAGSGWYHEAAIEAADRLAVEVRSNPYHH